MIGTLKSVERIRKDKWRNAYTFWWKNIPKRKDSSDSREEWILNIEFRIRRGWDKCESRKTGKYPRGKLIQAGRFCNPARMNNLLEINEKYIKKDCTYIKKSNWEKQLFLRLFYFDQLVHIISNFYSFLFLIFF